MAPPNPTPTIVYLGGIFCANASPVSPVTANTFSPGSGGFNTYFSQGGLSINPTTGVITPAASATGSYLVSYFESGPGTCTCIANATVVIAPVPNLTINGSNTVCLGGSISLTASGGGNYSWSNGATGNAVSLSPAFNTTISVGTTNSSGCSGFKSLAITVKPVPIITIQTMSVCAGKVATLTAIASIPENISYTWTPGLLTGSVVAVSPTLTTFYSVLGDAAGCVNSANQVVIVSPSFTPVTSFNYPFPLCTNTKDPNPFLDSLFALGGTFVAEDPVKVNASTGQISFANIEAGSYQVTYSLAAKGCTVAAISTSGLVVNQGGVLVASTNVSIIEGTGAVLNVSGGSAYAWTPDIALSCSDCESPVANPLETTTYCVSDIVDGCVLNACTKVEVLCLNTSDFSVPNAFTPNDDKINDKFCLQGWTYCVTDFKIVIYDRWGAKVFESNDPSFCWDGIYKDALLNSGVYIYAITAITNRLATTTKGNITLIR